MISSQAREAGIKAKGGQEEEGRHQRRKETLGRHPRPSTCTCKAPREEISPVTEYMCKIETPGMKALRQQLCLHVKAVVPTFHRCSRNGVRLKLSCNTGLLINQLASNENSEKRKRQVAAAYKRTSPAERATGTGGRHTGGKILGDAGADESPEPSPAQSWKRKKAANANEGVTQSAEYNVLSRSHMMGCLTSDLSVHNSKPESDK